MAGNKALKRALETKDSDRLFSKIPLITDETVHITPQMAMDMLEKNKNNRPINWRKVEEYAELMKRGLFKLHAQGIILDDDGYLLTGQTRLWAIIYADVPVYMRVSRGTPSDVAHLIDMGRPQTCRDLASRKTDKKHTQMEERIARASCVLDGTVKPTVYQLSDMIALIHDNALVAMKETRGMKKTKSVYMVLGAICYLAKTQNQAKSAAKRASLMVDELNEILLPSLAEKCWNKGAAFTMAMDRAKQVVSGSIC